jgi:hypothetical protein
MSKSLVTGLPQLRKKLLGLKSHLQVRVVPEELEKGAEAFADQVRENAPILSGDLQDSVAVVVGAPLDVQVIVTDESVGHVEYGRIGQVPNPFIRRSFGQKVRQVQASIRGGIARGIRKYLR